MAAALRAGCFYFAVTFAAGFVLGTVRVLVLTPGLGELRATLVELPLMLAISWWTCGRVIRRTGVAARISDRVTMGAVAFGLLMAAEIGLGIAIEGSAPPLASWLTLPKLYGLAGQILFALFPLMHLAVNRR